ncbi:hypothetical protein CDAR_456451 [Caerostris darwini]|uniref:Uncharacterized protein n=1 Tax=Caerostris darwini TaxID=1538125 RepID=A0AAV4P0C4_9ARAC|nr:hypothetical protein CDAR_456451 [Caerostris darwini]
MILSCQKDTPVTPLPLFASPHTASWSRKLGTVTSNITGEERYTRSAATIIGFRRVHQLTRAHVDPIKLCKTHFETCTGHRCSLFSLFPLLITRINPAAEIREGAAGKLSFPNGNGYN